MSLGCRRAGRGRWAGLTIGGSLRHTIRLLDHLFNHLLPHRCRPRPKICCSAIETCKKGGGDASSASRPMQAPMGVAGRRLLTWAKSIVSARVLGRSSAIGQRIGQRADGTACVFLRVKPSLRVVALGGGQESGRMPWGITQRFLSDVRVIYKRFYGFMDLRWMRLERGRCRHPSDNQNVAPATPHARRSRD